MLDDINKAKIVITTGGLRSGRFWLSYRCVGRSLLRGRHAPATRKPEGQMVRRVAEELAGLKNIVVINDEAHHCYREKAGTTRTSPDDPWAATTSGKPGENEAARLGLAASNASSASWG